MYRVNYHGEQGEIAQMSLNLLTTATLKVAHPGTGLDLPSNSPSPTLLATHQQRGTHTAARQYSNSWHAALDISFTAKKGEMEQQP